MNKSEAIPVIAVSVILLIYLFMILSGSNSFLIGFIFSLSPFLVMWLVYSVIKDGNYTGRELEENEEYGYTDKM